MIKTVSIYQYKEESDLNDKVAEWIRENENNLIEIVNIEYKEQDNVNIATIRYIE